MLLLLVDSTWDLGSALLFHHYCIQETAVFHLGQWVQGGDWALGLTSKARPHLWVFQAPDHPGHRGSRSHTKGSKGAGGHGWKQEALLSKAVASLKLWWVDWCQKTSFGELMGLRVCNKGFNEGKTWRREDLGQKYSRGVSSNASDECTRYPYSSSNYFK